MNWIDWLILQQISQTQIGPSAVQQDFNFIESKVSIAFSWNFEHSIFIHSIHPIAFKMGILTVYVSQVYKYLKISTNPQSLPNRHCKFYRVPEESCNSPLFEGSDRRVNLWGLRLTTMPKIEVPTLGHKCPFHPFF